MLLNKSLTLIAIGLLAACGSGESESTASTTRPHVLLISIDSLRADHCTPYGYRAEFTSEPTSPFLDRLAQEGVLFESASAPSSWTLPSHLSLFSAQPPREHGARLGRQMLERDPSKTVLAGHFKQAGYRTYGVWSAPFLHRAYGYLGAKGTDFDKYIPAEAYLEKDESDRIITNPQMRRMMEVHGMADATFDNAPRVNERAFYLLDLHAEDHADEPFFLFLHYWDVHYNYVPPKQLAQTFLPDYSERDAELGENFTPAHGEQESQSYSAADLARIKALYDAEIRAVDDAIAEVYAKLEELGFADNTIVAVVSDHGDHFGEEHEGSTHLFHHRTLFEEVVHIPFIVRAPGLVPAGKRVAGSVALYDVGPTLVDLAGLPAWEGVTGKSARPLWDEGAQIDHEVLMDLLHPGVPTQTQALRVGSRKTIWEMGHPPTRQAPQGAQPYLRGYDLSQDPREQQPISDLERHPWLSKAKLTMEAAAAGTRDAPQMSELPDEVQQALEDTGYTDVIRGDPSKGPK